MATPASSEAIDQRPQARRLSRVPRKAQTESAISRPHGTSLLIVREEFDHRREHGGHRGRRRPRPGIARTPCGRCGRPPRPSRPRRPPPAGGRSAGTARGRTGSAPRTRPSTRRPASLPASEVEPVAEGQEVHEERRLVEPVRVEVAGAHGHGAPHEVELVAEVGEGQVVAHAHRRSAAASSSTRAQDAAAGPGPLGVGSAARERWHRAGSSLMDAEDGAHPRRLEVDLAIQGELLQIVEGDAGRLLAMVLGLAEAVADPAQVAPQGRVAEAGEADPGPPPLGAGCRGTSRAGGRRPARSVC